MQTLAQLATLRAMQLLTTDEAARRLGLHPETVRRFLREGTLRGVKIGRAHRIEENEIAAYIDRLKAANPAQNHV